jgi:hypothetical protein
MGKAAAAEIRFGDDEQRIVDQLCAEFDPGATIPDSLRPPVSEEDWSRFLDYLRHELRGQGRGFFLRCS